MGVRVETRGQVPRLETIARGVQTATDPTGFYRLAAGADFITFAAAGYDTLEMEWIKIEKSCEESSGSDCTELRDVVLWPCAASQSEYLEASFLYANEFDIQQSRIRGAFPGQNHLIVGSRSAGCASSSEQSTSAVASRGDSIAAV